MGVYLAQQNKKPFGNSYQPYTNGYTTKKGCTISIKVQKVKSNVKYFPYELRTLQ